MSITAKSPKELTPQRLTTKQIENPYLALDDVFDFSDLSGLRDIMWDWITITVTGSFNRKNRIERCNLLYDYDKIMMLIEATHILFYRYQQEQIRNRKAERMKGKIPVDEKKE